MKTVLLIAYYYPPLGGIGSQRSQKFARYLGDFGWQPIVLAPESGSYYVDRSLDDLSKKGVEVIRTRALDLSSILKGLIAAGKPPTSKEYEHQEERQSSVGNLIRKRLKRAANTWVYIPDGQIGWYPYAIRAARQAVESHNVDVIWSTSFPVTAHLVAYRLKLSTNKPWIADFRDLWTENHYADYSSRLRKRIDQFIELKLLDKTDVIVTVSEVWANTLRELTGGRKRVEVIRNGFDSTEYEGLARTPTGKWEITYVGLFYGAKQDPTPFLTALRRAIMSGKIARADVRFNIVGQPDLFVQELIERFGLGDVTTFSGFVSHREAIGFQVNSSLLLLIVHGDRSNPGLVPGKLFEYLGARRPILGLIPPHFEAARIIADVKAGVTVEPSNIGEIERQLLASYAAYKAGEDPSLNGTDISRHERARGAEQLAGLLTELTTAGVGRAHARES